MVPGQPSSMVNTAEALYVLAKAGGDLSDCAAGWAFIRENLGEHLKSRGERVRYVAFPLLTLSECFPDQDRRLQRFMLDWLIKARNPDDGWGDEAQDGNSDIFSTYIAALAVSAAPFDNRSLVSAAGRWMVAAFQNSGWQMHSGQPYSATATAYAVEILARAGLSGSPAYAAGRELLLANDDWENEEAVISGTKWIHCKPAAVIRALAQAETDILLPTVAEGIRVFQRCITERDGWTERPGENVPTIRAQYWAAFGMAPLRELFDPAIVLPRVDAMRRQGALQEPAFLPFATGSRFHTILPAPLFRVIMWAALVSGLGLALGLDALLPKAPPRATSLAGLALLAGSLWLVRKRPRQFPRLSRWVGWLLILVGAAGAVFGVSPADFAQWGQDALSSLRSLRIR
jgi:hypothetical protein